MCGRDCGVPGRFEVSMRPFFTSSASVRVGIAVTCLLIGGCIFPTDSCACVRVVPRGVVEGRVVHASGAPAAGVVVTVAVATAACPASSYTARLSSAYATSTSSTGDYELPVVLDPDAPKRVCVRVTAQYDTRPAVVSAPATLTVASGPLDRVRVDLQLPK